MGCPCPKVFLANERTFLSWTRQGVAIGGFGIALLAYGDVHGNHKVVRIGWAIIPAVMVAVGETVILVTPPLTYR